MLLQAFVVETQANRFAFFSIFQTHRVYIYVYYLLARSIITVCVFHYYTQVSAEREVRQLKKNCISSNPPSASISFALFLKIVCQFSKKSKYISSTNCIKVKAQYFLFLVRLRSFTVF